jgi:hypothetical protein
MMSAMSGTAAFLGGVTSTSVIDTSAALSL